MRGGGTSETPFSKVANTLPVEGSVIQYARELTGTTISVTANLGVGVNGETTLTNLIPVIPATNTIVFASTAGTNTKNIGGQAILAIQSKDYTKVIGSQTIKATLANVAVSNTEVTAGVWIENYSANEPLGDIGLFVEGATKFPQADIAALTGTKTYAGVAVGYYHDTEFADNEPIIFESASATITVDFGDANETGRITAVSIADITEDDANFELTAGVRIDFQAVAIGDAVGGFTTGNSLATATDGSRYSGKWGSQFYYALTSGTDSGKPKYIAGTFGVTGTNPAAKDGSFIGVFFAR